MEAAKLCIEEVFKGSDARQIAQELQKIADLYLQVAVGDLAPDVEKTETQAL